MARQGRTQLLIRGQTGASGVVPFATMASAQALDGGWRVIDSQGEEHHFSNIDWDIAIETTPAATLPAQPGTYLINPGDGEGPKFWKSNVLGWMICADSGVRPVCIDPEALLSPWQVLHPDGRVERADGSSWESVDEWLAELALVAARLTENAATAGSSGE